MPLYIEYLRPGSQTVFYLTLDTGKLGNNILGSIEKIKEILEWQEERIPRLLGESVFKEIAKDENIDYWYSHNPGIRPNIILGGQEGFQTKTLVPVLARDNLAFTRTLLAAQFRKHQHLVLDKKISPRTLKLAYYQGKYYITGLCRLDIAEEVKI